MEARSEHAEINAAGETNPGPKDSTSIVFLRTLRGVDDCFPPFKTIITNVLTLVDIVSGFKCNRKEWEELSRHTAVRVAAVAKCFGKHPPSGLLGDIDSLNLVLAQVTSDVREMTKPRNILLWVTSTDSERKKINSFYVRIVDELGRFSLHTRRIVMRMGPESKWKQGETQAVTGDGVAEVTNLPEQRFRPSEAQRGLSEESVRVRGQEGL